MSPALIFALVQSIASGFALWRGGGPERTVGTIQIAAWSASMAAEVPFVHRYYSVTSAVFCIDVLMLAACLLVALKANRRWTLPLVSLQIVMVLMHLVRIIDDTAIRGAYQAMISLWSYPQIALLVFGTVAHQRRIRKHGADQDWSIYSSRSTRKRLTDGQIF